MAKESNPKLIVVYGGGFQPFHEGHMSSYREAKKKFPNADFYVAASNVTSERPLEFSEKQFLAKEAGVTDPFVQVGTKEAAYINDKGRKVSSTPLNPLEILNNYDKDKDILVIIRSEKDPMKTTSESYFQEWKDLESAKPFTKHAYIYYTKVKQFKINGEEIQSASQIRKMYLEADKEKDEKRKNAIIKQLYPNSKKTDEIKKIFDAKLGVGESLSEGTTTVTFAGKDPKSFQSPKGGKPVMVIVTGQGSRYLITDDGMVLRNKSFHANTGGEDQGLQAWSDKIEFYDRSTPLVSGALQDMAFPDAVSFLFDKGRIALSKTPQGDRLAMILDNGKWRPATIGDAIPKAIKTNPDWADVVIKAKAGSWGSTPKLNWQPLDYNLRPDGTLKRVHNGSPVTHGTKISESLSEGKIKIPKKYRAGLSKSTAGKRKRFWVKLGKYPYTKAEYSKAEKVPGDAKSETRPSQYNKKYQQMFGESRSIKALQKKAKATGIPYGILKQVYNRGMAAWVTGHRPGASQSAWAFARVNSFVTKGKTWRTADADLAKKARRYLKEAHIFPQYYKWGWIDPKGNIRNPIETDKTHIAILRRLAEEDPSLNLSESETETSATKKGWIRWLVEYQAKDKQYVVFFNTTKVNKLIKVYSSIERIVNENKDASFFNFLYTGYKYVQSLKYRDFISQLKQLFGVDESYLEEQDMDYEIEMASGQLKKIIDLATNTLNYIQNESQLDSWIQDKISVSAHNMEAIFDYFHYSEEKIEEKIIKKNKKYFIFSKDGKKKLGGPYTSKKKATKRLSQIEFFKHLNK